jgi:tetratricopeptide (TPR) repeat protein
VDAEEAADLRRRARKGSMGEMALELVGYKTVLGVARAQRGEKIAASEAIVRAAMERLRPVLRRALSEPPTPELVAEAAAIGRALVGVPLTRADLRAMTSAIGEVISVQGMAQQWKRGALVATMGLAMLPGDPYLSEQLANMLSDGGLPAEALEHAHAALEREQAFDEDGLARARATKAEILAKLGRVDEARGIIDQLVERRPDDRNASRVRRIVYEKVAN